MSVGIARQLSQSAVIEVTARIVLGIALVAVAAVSVRVMAQDFALVVINP